MLSIMAAGLVLMATITLDMDLAPWRAVNDGVMGGISSGGMRQDRGNLLFAGELSLENNGGFASVRRLVNADLSRATGVRFRLRGDGRSYQFRLRMDGGFDGVAWRVEFPTNGDWQTFEFRLDEFDPVFRGYKVADAGPVQPAQIRQLGFLIADGQAGPFRLEIESMEFFTSNQE